MAKSPEESSLGRELASFRYYKRNQGRLTRQLTAAALGLMLFFGCYTLSQGWLAGYETTYITVGVTYAAEEADPKLDQALAALAEEHGGDLNEEELTRRRGRRLEFAFPASRWWETTTELQQEAMNDIAQFREAVEKEYGTQVRVSTDTNRERDPSTWISFGIPLLLFAIGMWIIWRLINWPRFADFLVSVEAEMDKVSWPARQELFRATAVVVTTMVFLGMVLFLYDIFWVWLFTAVGVLQNV